ncbi:MAG: prepilin-type N-terminal cleavage/methylation domain-containing protein [Fibrobacter sp.]|nr:prepilin-type N-terminal cleavage/methylation domain-containing protein [Fibrobacter sp.]
MALVKHKSTGIKQAISGFTMLEVLVAMFIFGFIAISLLKALGTADHIHSRSVITMNSVLIAENAIENIRKKITYNESVEDCTYVETVGRREYTVQRRIIIPDSLLLENKQPSLLDIEINISPGVDNLQNNSPMTFRFLQGTTW